MSFQRSILYATSGTTINNWENNEVAGHAFGSAREPIEQGAIGGQPIEGVYHLIYAGEQTQHGSQNHSIGQPNAAGFHNGLMDSQGISPLPVVPPRYPHLPMRELIVKNLNFNPLEEVPLYQMHLRGRQRMQDAEMVRGIQFSDWAGARPPTTNMHCRPGWTVATESYDGIRYSRSVEETSQFAEGNQGGEHMGASRFVRQQTLDRSSPVEPLLTQGQICGGNYTWKIEPFSQLLQDASNGEIRSLESPPIYTRFRCGYKFFMRIFPKGVDGGDGRHIGLFVGMMQGDLDNRLKWPFGGRLSLSLLDQSNDAHRFCNDVIGTFTANRNLGAFQKPAAAGQYTTLYGYEEFAPIDMVRTPQYSKDDAVMIKIEINENI